MINAKDLRVGNTLHDAFLELQKVAAINKNRLRFENGDTSDYKNVNPIKLTGDILRHCGFENQFLNFTHSKIGSHIKFRKIRDLFYIKTTGGHPLVFIQYLHELENFYHSITKEELQFNHQNLKLCLI